MLRVAVKTGEELEGWEKVDQPSRSRSRATIKFREIGDLLRETRPFVCGPPSIPKLPVDKAKGPDAGREDASPVPKGGNEPGTDQCVQSSCF